MRRAAGLVILLLITWLGLRSCAGDGATIPGLVSVYLLLMILPGASLYLLIEQKPEVLEGVMSSLLLSPVLTGLAAVLLMVLGLPVHTALYLLALAWAGLAAAALLFVRADDGYSGFSGRRLLLLAGIAAVFCFLTSFLPFTSEWWRVRSDAWYHAAIINQIGDFGLPPEDPYFVGMPLQYMWVYHVLVLVLSRGMNITAGYGMALLNVQALAGFVAATFLLSWVLVRDYKRGVMAVLTSILGLNALFWIFLPIKLGRAFTGDVTGMDEVSRLVTLQPFDMYNVREFLYVRYNQVFFLDKFIVMTPFSLGLALMAGLWYGTVKKLSAGGVFPVVLVLLVTAGLLAFHTVVGIIMLAGFGSALLLYRLRFAGGNTSSGTASVVMMAALVAAAVILAPYLYHVMHGKESEQLLPIGISFKRTLGIVISCALGFLLAAFQIRKKLAGRTPEIRFFTVTTIFVIVYCLLIVLPGPNMFDKPPFFIFYPLSVAGGWTLADWLRKKRITAVVLLCVFFLPVNVMALVGYFNTAPGERVTQQEREAAAWIAANTRRDAVFLDGVDNVFLAVAGPRRLYYGRDSYAGMWGYDSEEMDRRKRARDNLYSDEPVTGETLAALSAIKTDVYVIVRRDQVSAVCSDKFAGTQGRFDLVFSSGPLSIFRVVKGPE